MAIRSDDVPAAGGARPQTEAFLALAEPDARARCVATLAAAGRCRPAWAHLQQAFLSLIDDYVEVELARDVEENIHLHEAGGQWRIAFPHLAVRGDSRIAERFEQTMVARRRWARANLHHGFPDCAEVHHEIETFIYFQQALFYAGLKGAETALESIEDVAHHVGNWVADVPAWYDWGRREFLSTWLGTREVRNGPPHDYQEANHFRFVDTALAAWRGTGDQRYADLAAGYADRWCEHIEVALKADGYASCSILPAGARRAEMVGAGAGHDEPDTYKVFYTTVADNTAYDIAGALLDIYRTWGSQRHLAGAQAMMDQFVQHAVDGRPPTQYSDGRWATSVQLAAGKEGVPRFVHDCTFLARFAVRHDLLTGEQRYRRAILDWAAAIDEQANEADQMMANVLVAAHFYDGDPAWLARAYAMALRHAAVVESKDGFHQCNWSGSRQGTKFLMETLYQPLLGGVEWGTRGNIPVLRLAHRSEGRDGLPQGVSLRTWRLGAEALAFEAANLSQTPAAWALVSADPERPTVHVQSGDGVAAPGNALRVAPGEEIAGLVRWS